MGHWAVFAQGGDHLSRAADHAMVIGVVALVAVVGGLVYVVARHVGRSRASRSASNRAESARQPDA
jgi:hypothetical protein